MPPRIHRTQPVRSAFAAVTLCARISLKKLTGMACMAWRQYHIVLPFCTYCSARSPRTASLLEPEPKCFNIHVAILGGCFGVMLSLLSVLEGLSTSSSGTAGHHEPPVFQPRLFESSVLPGRHAQAWSRPNLNSPGHAPADDPTLHTHSRRPLRGLSVLQAPGRSSLHMHPRPNA